MVDMEFYYGADWRTSVQPTLAAKKYVERINEVARDDSNLLIAHQYTRCAWLLCSKAGRWQLEPNLHCRRYTAPLNSMSLPAGISATCLAGR